MKKEKELKKDLMELLGSNSKEMAKFIYSMEIDKKGIVDAFKDNMKVIEEAPRDEVMEEEVSDSEFIRCKSEAKLNWICWTLMYKDFDEHTEVAPLLIDELKNVTKELEEFYSK